METSFCTFGGVNIVDYKNTFIGRNVTFDSVHPENITIESGVRITANSAILTHYVDPQANCYEDGRVIIKRLAFIGTGTIITKPITIGFNSVIGAGSVVTKNIPDNEIWAGNLVRYIKTIERK